MPVLGGIDHPVMLGGATQPESPSSAGAAPQRQQQQRPRPASAAAPAAPADIPVISAVRKLVSYTGRGCQNVLVDEPGSIVGRESKSLAWVGGADETKCVVELHRSRRAQRDHPFVRVALTPSSARAAPAVCTLLTSSSPHAGFARVHRSRVEGAREHAVRLPLQGLDRYLCVLLSGGTGHSHRVARLEVMLVPDAPQRRGVDVDVEEAAAATVAAAAAASEEDVASSAAAPPVAPTPQRYDGGGGGGARGGNDHSSISNVSCIEPSGPREGPRSRGAYGGGGGGGGSSGEVFDDDAAPPPPKTAQSPQCAWAVRPQSRLAEQEGEEEAVVRPPVMPGHAADGDSRHHNNNTNNDSTVVVDISASQIFGEGGPLAGLSHNYHNHLQQQGQQQPHERHNDTSLHASHLHSDPSEGTRHSGLAPRGLGFASSHNTTAAEDDDDESALVMDVTRERVEDVLMYQQQQRAQQHQHHHHQSRHPNRSGSSSSVGSPGRRSSCASEGDAAEHLSRDAGAAVVAAVRPPAAPEAAAAAQPQRSRTYDAVQLLPASLAQSAPHPHRSASAQPTLQPPPPAYLPELQPLRRSAPAPAVPVPPAALQAQAEEPAAAAALSQPRAAHPQLFVQEVCTVQMQAAAAVAAPSRRAGAAARADQTMVIEVGGDFEQAAAAAAAGVAAHNTSRASLHTPSAAGGAWGDRSAVAVSRTLLMEQYTATPDTTPPQPAAAASRSRRDARPQHDHHHHHRHPAAAVTPTSAGRASSGCSSVSSGAQSAPRSTESRVPSRPPPCVPSPTALSPPHTQQPPQQQQRQHRRERAERAPAAPSSRPSGSMSMLLESVPNMGPADKLFTAAMRTLISGNISTTTLAAERSFAAASAGAGGGGGAPPSTAAVPSLSGCRSSSAAVSAVSGQENRSVEQRLSFNTPKPRTPLEGPKKARSPLRPISRPYSL